MRAPRWWFGPAGIVVVTGCSLLDWDALEGGRAGASDDGGGGNPAEGGSQVTAAEGGAPGLDGATDPYAEAVLQDGPDAWLRFEEDDGAPTARDSAGQHSGSYPAEAIRGLEGAVGRALRSGNEAVTLSLIGEITAAANAPFTIEAWGYLEDAGSGFIARLGDQVELYFGDVSTQKPGAMIARHCCGFWDKPSILDVTAGQWVHLAGVYDGSRLTTYVNGVAESGGSPGALTGKSWSPNLSVYPGVRIDELAYYTKALAGERVLAHCRAGGKCQ